MHIRNLGYYKKQYNKIVEENGERRFVWDTELFIEDTPITESEEINNILNTCRTNLKFELSRKFIREKKIRSIEGRVYITLKRYFDSAKGKEDNSNIVYS